MKKYIFTILLAFLTATAQGQPNQRLQQLDEFLQQQGINVSHQQTNAIDGSITHIMHAFPNLVNLNATSFPQDMSEEEKQTVTDLFLMAGLEAVQTNHNIDGIRIETKNKLGSTISTQNTGK